MNHIHNLKVISIISSKNYDHTLGEKNDIKKISSITTITNILNTFRKQNLLSLLRNTYSLNVISLQ